MGCSSHIQNMNPFKESYDKYTSLFSNLEIICRENEEFKVDFNSLVSSTYDEIHSKEKDNKVNQFFTKHFPLLQSHNLDNQSDIKHLVRNQQAIDFILTSNEVNFTYRKSVSFIRRLLDTCCILSLPRSMILEFLKSHSKDFPYEQIGPEINIDVISQNNIKFNIFTKNLIYNQRFQNLQFVFIKLTKSFCMNIDNFYEITKLISSQIYLLTIVIEISFEESESEGNGTLLYHVPLILNEIVSHPTIKNFVFMCRDALKCTLTDEIYKSLKAIMYKHNMIGIHFRNIKLNNEILEGFIGSHSRYIGLESSEPDFELFEKIATAIMKHTKIIFCLLTGFGIDPLDINLFMKKIYNENSNVTFNYLERLNIDFNDLEEYFETNTET